MSAYEEAIYLCKKLPYMRNPENIKARKSEIIELWKKILRGE